VQLIAKIKLILSSKQKDSLKCTLQAANNACNYISAYAFENKIFNRFELQRNIYEYVKQEFCLPAQLVIKCIQKVSKAYTNNKAKQNTFYHLGSIPYDNRILSWKENSISLTSIEGRIKDITFACCRRANDMLKNKAGEHYLLFKNNNFYIHASCEVKESPLVEPKGFLGVDLGIVNIATTSDGKSYSGENIDKNRRKYSKLRASLQRRGTPSAKRKLKRNSRKQSNFVRNTNHCISKEIVHKAKALDFGIALEELHKIKQTVSKDQTERHQKWSFYQLRSFILYKAEISGVKACLVNPKNTSRRCSRCGFVDKKNRKSRDEFFCLNCSLALDADFNASLNIGKIADIGEARAIINKPIVAFANEDESQVCQQLQASSFRGR
jgi:putative transposase